MYSLAVVDIYTQYVTIISATICLCNGKEIVTNQTYDLYQCVIILILDFDEK